MGNTEDQDGALTKKQEEFAREQAERAKALDELHKKLHPEKH